MSAGGQLVPPFFVFPRKRMNERLMINAPHESVAEAQPNGWMNADSFLKWMGHFIKYSNPSEQSPVLLILDGHASHKDLDVIEHARKHHIHMLSTPPHTTHKLQPLDRTFMKPFKSAYSDACDLWMRSNPGVRISEYEIAGLVASAFNRVSRIDIVINGFRCTGIHPFNRNIFTDLDYLGSDMTNVLESHRPVSEPSISGLPRATHLSSQQTEPKLTPQQPKLTASTPGPPKATPSTSQQPELIASTSELPNATTSTSQQLELTALTARLPEPTTSTSRHLEQTPSASGQIGSQIDASQQRGCQTATVIDQSVDNFKALITELSPVPDASKRRATARHRKAERSEIYTSSPYKNMLEEKQKDTKRVESAKRGKSLMSGKDVSKKSKKNKTDNQNHQQGPTQAVTFCPLCLESHDEDWIQCGNCKAWIHEACANISELSNQYICDYCLI